LDAARVIKRASYCGFQSNNIRILDGLTGTLIIETTLDPPFQSVDTGGCGDIPNTVGIAGIPIIDPATDIM
jgi:hypothetical protein